MRTALFVLAMFAAVAVVPADAADGDAKRGAEVYGACVSCHALEPGLHLTGPSLDGSFGRLAGTAEGFARYSPGLKDAGFEWNATALDAWLQNPADMIPETYMAFRGIDDAQARADLIAFLEIAASPGGGAKAVAGGLMPAAWLQAIAPEPVDDTPAGARVAAMRHCDDSYFVRTEDGRETPHWEKNVRLKIDSVETGPPPGVPVVVGSGMGGDRVSVIFSSLSDLTSLVEERC